jgi:hypothetical protein
MIFLPHHPRQYPFNSPYSLLNSYIGLIFEPGDMAGRGLHSANIFKPFKDRSLLYLKLSYNEEDME